MGDFPIDNFYKEIIEVCVNRIDHVRKTRPPATNQENLSFDFNTQNLSTERIEELKSQLNQCTDPDLLVALRDEFKRQLELHIKRQTPIKAPEITEPEHHFFRKDSIIEGISIVKYWHFDKQRIARELILPGREPPQLLLTGRDDNKMCQWNLEEAKIVDDFKDEISESEFNSLWFKYGGFPYVRSIRKARRLLTTALFKKH